LLLLLFLFCHALLPYFHIKIEKKSKEKKEASACLPLIFLVRSKEK